MIGLGNCNTVDKYTKISRIGEGTYGTVYGALDKQTNQLVALKRITLHNESQDGFPLTSIREISCLRRCSNHVNCVRLLDVVVNNKRDGVFLVFEYCEHDLSTLTRNIKHPFKESEIKTITMQLLSAIDYLHSNWIIHRDIKLSNILYNHKGQVKLADFGLARSFSIPIPSDITCNVVTLWYRSPELLLGQTTYSFPIDVWAIGCTFGELMIRRPMLPGDNEIDQLKRIFNLLGSPNEHIWPGVSVLPYVTTAKIDLIYEQANNKYNNISILFPTLSVNGLAFINRMLAYDPMKRLTAKEAHRDKYFYESPYPKEEEFMPTFPSLHKNINNVINNQSNNDDK